jgi:hypothetical protein
MKQTSAVEWLEQIIYDDKEFSLLEVFEQAKEMEKQKQQKYNEMLEMLKICKQTTNSKQIYDEIEQLIKSATEL